MLKTIPSRRSRTVLITAFAVTAAAFLLFYAAGSSAVSNSTALPAQTPDAQRPAAPAPESTCSTLPNGVVSWWPGEGNTLDRIRLNNGQPEGNLTYTAGRVGQAFDLDGVAADIKVPASATLDVGTGDGMTIEMWVRPADLYQRPLVEWNQNGNLGVQFWIGGNFSSGTLTANLTDTANGSHIVQTPTAVLSTNVWQHVAMTYDRASGVAILYLNGSVVAGPASIGSFSLKTWSEMYIGSRPQGNQYVGQIDEPTIYNRALSAAELTAIINAGSAGKCSPCTAAPIGTANWWRAEGNMNDSVGTSHGSLANGATYAAGKVGQAFSFDGVDDYASVPASTDWAWGTGDFTVHFWEYANGSVYKRPLVNNRTNVQSESEWAIEVYNAADRVEFHSGYTILLTATNLLNNSSWNHIAVTRIGGTLTIYINGVASGSVANANNFSDINALQVARDLLPQGVGDLAGPFPGKIDELSMLRRGLSAAEIQAIYSAGGSGMCPQCVPAPGNRISMWPGESNGFDIVSGYNGNLNGTTFTAGKVGQAFRFSGAQGSYAEIQDNPALNPTNAFSIDGWFYIDPAAPGNEIGTLAGKSNGELTSYWSLYFDNRGGTKAIRFVMGKDVSYDNAIPAADWYHVAGTFDSTTVPRAKLYLNGVKVADSGTAEFGVTPNSLNLRIGAMYWTETFGVGNDRFNGLADEVEFFGRALTAAEIQDVYAAGGVGRCRTDLGRAYVPNSADGTVSVIDIGTNAIASTISAPQQFGFVAIKNDGSKAYVSGAALSKVTVIDTAANTVLTNFTLPGATHGLAVDRSGTKLYVAQEFGTGMWVLDADSGTLLATIPIGVNPFGVAVAPDGRHVYTSNYSSGTMSVIKTADNSVETFATGSIPYGIAVTPDSSRVYVANAGSNSVSVINAATNTIITNIAFPCPTGVAVNPSGLRAYVGSCSGNDMLAIDTSNNTSQLIPLGRTVEGVSVSADGSRVLAAAKTANMVLSVNVATNMVSAIPVGSAPYAIGQFIAQHLPASPPPPTSACSARPGGITAWWRGEGNILDQRKAHIGSLVNGATYAPGLTGRAFSLDGTDDHVSIPAFDMGADWTIEGWMDPTACSDNNHCTLFARSNGNFDGIWIGYLGAGHPWNNEFAFDIGNGTEWQVSLHTTTKYSIGNWDHVAATKSGDTYTLYVNGVKRAEQTAAGVSTTYQSRDILLGKWTYLSGAFMQGKIDELSTYKRALTPNEIWSIYSADSYGKCVGTQTMADMDGDMLSDLAIFRPSGASGAEWWWLKSSGGNGAVQFGSANDAVVTADYTGDGKTDIAYWQPSTGFWYVLRSEDLTYYAFPFGGTGDVPVPADYDGDGRADAAVFRASNTTWYISRTTGGTGIVQFGLTGDKPVVDDYDGDGKADIAVFRPNGTGGAEWWIMQSSGGVFATQFGQPTDKAVPADYTGDGRADIAFWQPATGYWFVLRSDDYSYYAFPFGAAGDMPVPADYDGDAKTDAAVYRPTTSNWFISRSKDGLLIRQFGSAGDVPVPSAFVR